MDEFTIYCTAEQTRKGLELGAPICKCAKDNNDPDLTVDGWGSFDGYWLLIPTAEQMIGFIATKGVFVGVAWDYINKKWESYTHVKNKMIGCDNYNSREEATLAAIDEALDYLASHQINP